MQVDIVALNIPDYAEIIKKPMHLYAIADGLAVSFPFSVLPCLLGFSSANIRLRAITHLDLVLFVDPRPPH
jgi:hypothetical protein